MIFVDGADFENYDILLCMGDYHPYWNYGPFGKVPNEKFNDFSNHILNLKKNEEQSINYFFELVDPEINPYVPICVVPSSNSAKMTTGIRTLARMLAMNRRIDATSCLVRHTSILKATDGGPRNIQTHLDSIHVINSSLIQGKTVLLLDDIATTESSINACSELLLNAGASEVQKLVLGYTKRYYF